MFVSSSIVRFSSTPNSPASPLRESVFFWCVRNDAKRSPRFHCTRCVVQFNTHLLLRPRLAISISSGIIAVVVPVHATRGLLHLYLVGPYGQLQPDKTILQSLPQANFANMLNIPPPKLLNSGVFLLHCVMPVTIYASNFVCFFNARPGKHVFCWRYHTLTTQRRMTLCG